MSKHILRPRIHILCNGEVLEYQYFSDFRDHIRKARNIIIPNPNKKKLRGISPWKLIDRAIEYKNLLSGFDEGDQVWCVFDVDQYWQENSVKFQKAIKQAENNNIYIAWSNECFELWLLLHFQVVSGEIPRKNYHTKLKSHFNKLQLKYEKNMSDLFSKTFDRQKSALKNAHHIYKKETKVTQNPSTNVFKLIEELRKFL